MTSRSKASPSTSAPSPWTTPSSSSRSARTPSRNANLHAVGAGVEAQEEWLNRYFETDDDYYFIIRRRGGSWEGAIGIYDVSGGTAEWGRWVMRPGSLGAAESALLVYRAGFERLGVAEMYCLTVARNAQVVSFHDACGLRRVTPRRPTAEIGGEEVAMVQHELTRRERPAVEAG